MATDSSLTHSAFADALTRARQLAAKIGSGEKRPLEDGEGMFDVLEGGEANTPKRPNSEMNGSLDVGAPNGAGIIDGPGVDANGVPQQQEQMAVPDHMVGLIIGRGGEQINNIQTSTRCRVQMAQDAVSDSTGMSDRICTLTGSVEAIQAAKDMIMSVITKASDGPAGGDGTSTNSVVEEILVPGSKVGLVIGKGGENLKKIQEQLGVRMIVIQETNSATMHEKPLRIIGRPDKVHVAKQMVIQQMNSKDDSGRSFDMFSQQKSLGEVIVPRIAVGVIIGKGGDMIKRITTESLAKVQFKLNEDPNGPERTAIVTGTPDQIQKATQMITELVNQAMAKQSGGGGVGGPGMGGPPMGGMGQFGNRQEVFYMHVPSTKTGLVIGKGGETIRQINQESGAHVELSRDAPPNEFEKIFIIKGSPQAIHTAQHLIRIRVGDLPPGTPCPAYQPAPVAQQPQPAPAAYPGYPQPNAYAPAQAAPHAGQQDPNAAAWAAYYAQCYQQQQAAGGYPGGQPGAAPVAAGGHAPQAASHPQTTAPAQMPTQATAQTGAPTANGQSTAPTVNPVTGQPDYSRAWVEYYRSLGMHEQAALIEQQAKATEAAAHQVQPQQQIQQAQQPNYAAYASQAAAQPAAGTPQFAQYQQQPQAAYAGQPY